MVAAVVLASYAAELLHGDGVGRADRRVQVDAAGNAAGHGNSPSPGKISLVTARQQKPCFSGKTLISAVNPGGTLLAGPHSRPTVRELHDYAAKVLPAGSSLSCHDNFDVNYNS